MAQLQTAALTYSFICIWVLKGRSAVTPHVDGSPQQLILNRLYQKLCSVNQGPPLRKAQAPDKWFKGRQKALAKVRYS